MEDILPVPVPWLVYLPNVKDYGLFFMVTIFTIIIVTQSECEYYVSTHITNVCVLNKNSIYGTHVS